MTAKRVEWTCQVKWSPECLGAFLHRNPRTDSLGRIICRECAHLIDDDYQNNWHVKSLMNKPRKPLPGQGELFGGGSQS